MKTPRTPWGVIYFTLFFASCALWTALGAGSPITRVATAGGIR